MIEGKCHNLQVPAEKEIKITQLNNEYHFFLGTKMKDKNYSPLQKQTAHKLAIYTLKNNT